MSKLKRVKRLSTPEMHPLDLPAPLAMIHRAKAEVVTLKRDRRFIDPKYEMVWLALCDVEDALDDALNEWPA